MKTQYIVYYRHEDRSFRPTWLASFAEFRDATLFIQLNRWRFVDLFYIEKER